MAPVGRYKFRGGEAALGYTNDGSPQVAVEVQIAGGPHAGEAITWYGYFTEKTTERTIATLRALGWKGKNLDDLSGIGETEVDGRIYEEEYQGEKSLKVQLFAGGGGVAMKNKMDPNAAKSFARQMAGAVLAFDQKHGTAPANNRPAQAAPQRMREPGEDLF